MSFRSLGVERLEDRRVLATLTVNVTSDAALDSFGDGLDDGSLTLREAIAAANGTYTPVNPSGDLLQIDQTTDPLGQNDVIVFDFDADPAFSGITGDPADDIRKAKITLLHSVTTNSNELNALEVTRSVTIDGGAGRELEISAAGLNRRVMEIDVSPTTQELVTLKNLAITDGDLTEPGGFTQNAREGGAGVYVRGEIVVDTVRFENNHVTDGNGGGLYVDALSSDSTVEPTSCAPAQVRSDCLERQAVGACFQGC